MLLLWQQLKFSSWPKIQLETPSLSTISAAMLWLVCCDIATGLSPLCDTVSMFLERETSYSMCCTFHIRWRVIVFYTNNTSTYMDEYTDTHKKTNSQWHECLSLQLMFREAATQFHGVLFWIKSSYGQHCLNVKRSVGSMSHDVCV